jgi:uncharacterized membrane protein
VSLLHLHLLLNHLPTVAFGLAAGLLVASWLGRSEDLKRASCVLLFIIALVAIPTYVTGDAARFALRERDDVSADLMAAHREAAMLALIPMQMTGVLAWVAVWRFRRWILPALVALSFVTLALMARAATVGGGIRHPEVLGDAVMSGWPDAAALGAALVLDYPWVWPICEVFHFVGLCLLFGVVLLVNLRVLGVLRGVAFADVSRLMPWALLGFLINVVTGMLFFLAAPDQYTQNTAFAWKIGLVVTAGATLIYPVASEELRGLKPDAAASATARMVAAASVLLWTAVIFLGRFLPYLGSE